MVFEMKHITKTYGSVVANDDVSLHLNRGEILSIVGENGAGKSTIMKILYGLERPDSGEILVDGQPRRFHSPSDAMAVGIGMVQQHFMLFEEMTVAEAKAQGAIGLFESKYGERVKVYTMGEFSKEICGGPHASNPGDLKSFKIKKEEASSAGVRRIKATIGE